jgi:nickel-dependent lactate racemase
MIPMRICLDYGETGLDIDLPDGEKVTVIEPRRRPALADPAAALTEALRRPIGAPPLREVARSRRKIGIVFSDITRAAPHRLILPAVLAELAGISRNDIVLFNALGTHRPNSRAELRVMLGDEIVDACRIVQNDAFDPSTQVALGTTSRGHEIRINAELAECDLKILTGFIEPHLFAGFSGGGKAVMPGMAGQKTVLGNHDARMIADPKATWGVTRGNPIWEEIREVASAVGGLFLVNVTLNREKEVTGVFAGDLDKAHSAGCAFVRETAMVPLPEPFDIVITTNSGYPLDLNLYQAVKGLSAAAGIVRPGGALILASECRDGIPRHGMFGRLLAEAGSPGQLLEKIHAPGFIEQDQWQAQILATILTKADVYVRSDGLTDEEIRSAMLEPCPKIETTVTDLILKSGPGATIGVLPQGPLTIPCLEPD